MFKACKIKLFQNDDEWMFVRLNGPLPPATNSYNEFVQWTGQYPLSGPFYVRENSVTKTRDSGKFVVSTVKWPEQFWGYSIRNRSLTFVSRGTWVGGGLKHGEKEIRLNPVLTLHDVMMTADGIRPAGNTYTGKATVESGGGMPMFRPGNVISWEWRSWDWTLHNES